VSPRHLSRPVRLLAVALLVLGSALAVGVSAGNAGKRSRGLNRAKHIVVIYEENHSFDNLYGKWEGVNGLRRADRLHRRQVKQDRKPFRCLPQNDVNLDANLIPPPLTPQCSDVNPADGSTFQSHFFNRRRRTGDGNPFTIDRYLPPEATTCPKETDTPPARNSFGIPKGKGTPGGCTRDLEHRFYQEQYQINGGRQNRYTIGSDALGLTQGVYETRNLPIYRYLHQPGHPKYAISDAFFQAAHGGSFLSHVWLIAARTPRYDNAPSDRHSIVDENGMPVTNTNPGYMYKSPSSEKLNDGPLTAACDDNANHDNPSRDAHGNVCGDWAVNTIQPKSEPFMPGTALVNRLPLQDNPTIGDRLSAAGKSWAWYAGGWSNADHRPTEPGWTNNGGPVSRTLPPPAGGTNPNGCPDPNANPAAKYPFCPDAKFQFHHQPFNYFAPYARGGDDGRGEASEARLKYLRDEQEFIGAAQASKSDCKLRDVSFVKPIGSENEHPGYASEPNGSDHLVELLKEIEGSACRKDTMVIVTYDEFGGQWDHASPPGTKGNPGPDDSWGPGTRIPALTLAPGLRDDFVVDHRQHDTTSILATIEHGFGLKPVSSRDARTKDMSSVFRAKAVRRRHHR
jgi:acid phosphatase